MGAICARILRFSEGRVVACLALGKGGIFRKSCALPRRKAPGMYFLARSRRKWVTNQPPNALIRFSRLLFPGSIMETEMKRRLTVHHTRSPNALRCFSQTALLCVLPLASMPAAQITWTNLAGGVWNSAANWSPNQVPGATDNAMIAMPVGVTLTGSNSVLSLALSGNSSLIALGTNTSIQGGGQWVGAGVTLNASNVTVAAGSAMTADGQGYSTGAGLGGASAGNYFAGGSYGGQGSGCSRPIHGRFRVPTARGSAGGGRWRGY